MTRFGAPLLLLLAAACSRSDTADDVPPLPEQNAETANLLMREAERAAGDAAARAETSGETDRSGGSITNKETP